MHDKYLVVALLSVALAGFAIDSSGATTPAAPDSAATALSAVSLLELPLVSGTSWTATMTPALPGFTVRHTVSEVRMQFTVADSRDRLLQSLSPGDLRILDNRITVSRISSFSRQDDLPLQVGVLLDVSDSVERARFPERQAAEYFFSHVLNPKTDRAALLAFGGELRVWQRFTGDRDTLSLTVSHIRQDGYATYLYDSVFHACHEQFASSRDDDTAQRVLVVISDGEDTGSLHSLSDAITMALRREVQVFAISIHSPRTAPKGDLILQNLTEATGGKFYVANSPKDFQAMFASMAGQMRTHYSVSFQPVEQTPGFHSVKIQVSAGDKLRIHARQGYFFDAQ